MLFRLMNYGNDTYKLIEIQLGMVRQMESMAAICRHIIFA